MTPLHRVDGGRHRILSVRYGLPEDAPIPPLLSRTDREADLLLGLAGEIRTRARHKDYAEARQSLRRSLAHVRRAWIGHCCGNLALYELEAERAWAACYLFHNPLMTTAGKKLLADQRRSFALSRPNGPRNRKLRELAAAGIPTQTLAERFGKSTRQIRAIKAKPKRK